MSVLDTFYILFKTNADDVKRGMGEVDKKTKETEKSLKNSNEEADKLGKSFVKMAEAGAALVAGYIGFDELKKGILDVAAFNAGLGRTAALAGQSAQSLKQMGQAAFQQGGDINGAIQNILTIQQHLAEVGKSATPEEIIEGWRAALAGKDTKTQLAMFPRLGIQDIGLQTIATMSAADFKKNWHDAGRNAATSQQDIKVAQDFLTEMAKTTAAFQKLEQIVGTPLLKAVSNLLNLLTDWFTANNDAVESNSKLAMRILAHPVDTFKSDIGITRDWIKEGGASDTIKAIKDYNYSDAASSLAKRTATGIKSTAQDIQDWWNNKPEASSLSNKSSASPSANPPSLDPMSEWKNAVIDPAYIKQIQATGQTDVYATEAQRGFASQVNHINKGSANTVYIDSVTVNTQATDGKGTADAFKQMLSNVAGNMNDGVSK